MLKPVFKMALASLAALAALWLASAGCSEKPGDLVWQPAQPGSGTPPKVGINSIVALSADDVIAVGFRLPEGGLGFRPVGLHRTAAGWGSDEVPGYETESLKLLALARAPDGTLWACGSVTGLGDELASAKPVIYRYSGGAWSEVGLAEAGDLLGTELVALATGPDGEIRAVGPAAAGQALVLRFSSGHWSRMALPDPTGGSGANWALNAVARSPAGNWYAVGGSLVGGVPGGVIFKDAGTGWQTQPGPGIQALDLRALAFDGKGDPWLGGNYPLADSAHGVLYQLSGGQFTPHPIRLARSGAYLIYALAFDPIGAGWVVGGRAPDDPFIAGNGGGATWSEVNVDTDLLAGLKNNGRPGETGGELYSISLFSEAAGFTAGHAEESNGHEGGTEFIPRVFRLTRKPVGEVDKPASPLRPR